MARLSYLRRSAFAQFSGARQRCPNCGASAGAIVDSKYIITQLRRCNDCALLYRTPTDGSNFNARFYQREYRQGAVTDLPSDAELMHLKQSNFNGTPMDYTYYIDVLRQLGIRSGARIFDYGCSWGYGSHQLREAGMNLTGLEIGSNRRRFAVEKMKLDIVDDLNSATATHAGEFDLFFSAHVIEHVPSPSRVFECALKLLNPGGIFVSFTPNGSMEHRNKSPDWSRHWGEVHPNFIDDLFLDKNFSRSPRALGSSPVANAKLPDASVVRRLNAIDGGELFFAARKTGDNWS